MDSRVLKTAVLHWVIPLGVCLLLQACNKQEVPYYNTADLTPLWQQSDSMHIIAPFNFTDQAGKEITNNSFDGKVYVANFFFTQCPGICPKIKNNLQLVADTFKDSDQVRFISHSVTPYIDSVSRLKEYATAHNINNEQWHLVTGRQAEIYELARKSYFAEDEIGFNYDSTDFLHTERVVLVDKHRHIRGVYNGTVKLEMARMIADIKLLLEE